MEKPKLFSEPILIIKSFDENNPIFMSGDFVVEGDYDPDAEWME